MQELTSEDQVSLIMKQAINDEGGHYPYGIIDTGNPTLKPSGFFREGLQNPNINSEGYRQFLKLLCILAEEKSVASPPEENPEAIAEDILRDL